MWNNRVEVTRTEIENYVEFSASIIEVYYEPKSVGSTGEIAPMGTGETEHDAILDLKAELERMLESVNFVLEGKTSVYNYQDTSTHNPGAKSELVKSLTPRYNVIDPDDDYMDEKHTD